jgi:hypothetical protein
MFPLHQDVRKKAKCFMSYTVRTVYFKQEFLQIKRDISLNRPETPSYILSIREVWNVNALFAIVFQLSLI